LIRVPVANDAEPVLPTATLMPVGLDVTRSPERPVAVTVSVAVPVWACGLTVSVVVRVTPPALAVIVTGVEAVTVPASTVNVRLVEPCGTVTLVGTATAALVSDSATVKPFAPAAAVSVTVPVALFGPTTLAGLTETAESAAAVVAARGVKRRTVENGPGTPAELIARTRHQCRRAASVGDRTARRGRAARRHAAAPGKHLLLVIGYLRRLLDLHLDLVDEIERELA
jgi:hypothetical protein